MFKYPKLLKLTKTIKCYMSPEMIQISDIQYHIQNIFAENVYSESNQASITNFEFTKDTDDGGAS